MTDTTSRHGQGQESGKQQQQVVPGEQPGNRKITRPEAIRMAKALRSQGATYQQIADQLTDRGWRSLTGGSATIGGVASLLGRRPFRRAQQEMGPTERGQETQIGAVTKAAVEGPNGDNHMLTIISAILDNTSMSVGDRVAACQLLIGAHLTAASIRGKLR